MAVAWLPIAGKIGFPLVVRPVNKDRAGTGSVMSSSGLKIRWEWGTTQASEEVGYGTLTDSITEAVSVVLSVSLTKRLKKNSGLRAHKAETVFRKGHQPEEPLLTPHPGDTSARRTHDLGHSNPEGLYRLPKLEYPPRDSFESNSMQAVVA